MRLATEVIGGIIASMLLTLLVAPALYESYMGDVSALTTVGGLMESIWTLMLLALLPALGNFGGGLLAEFTNPSKSLLNKALHASAGIVIAVVAIELMPEALSSISPWIIGIAFGLGGIAYVGIEALVEKFQSGQDRSRRVSSSMWMIYIAVSIDLFGDGLLIGAGSAVSFSMALVLALGQVLADVPEGYATVATMKDKGLDKPRWLLLSVAFAVPVLGAAIASYYLLRNQDAVYQMATLSFTAGLLAVAAVEDMLSEAHESSEDTRGSILFFTGGFVLFVFVSAGLG